jgi:hypothetical protein
MWVLDGVVAGLIAGVFMGIFSQLGYWFGLVNSHLIVIDGAFALRMMKQDVGITTTYAVGIVIHLVTSIAFGFIYVIIAKILDIEVQQVVPIVIYVFILWLAMLVVALPFAGQGFMGNKIRRIVWLEQLVLHLIFGFGFWWALGIV